MQQPLYGLIGGKLGHSYSKIIHEQIADYTYDLLPLPTEAEARAFMEKRAFAAINVTIPYKQLVIPYCDEVDPKAKASGAVNTIAEPGRQAVRLQHRLRGLCLPGQGPRCGFCR